MNGYYWTCLVAICVLIPSCDADGGLITVVTAVGKGVGILNSVKGLLTSRRHKMTDITPPGLHFDFIEDHSYCQLLQKMDVSEFEVIVTEIAQDEFEYPHRIKNRIMRGKRAPISKVVVSDFRYEVGKGGSIMYGFIATMRHGDNTFDLAICMQNMDFKLAPRQIKHESKEKFLGMTMSESVWIEYVETSLSQEQKEQLENYLRGRTFKTFTRDFASLLPREKGPEQLSFCSADEDNNCLNN